MSTAVANPASEKQTDFIKRLFTEASEGSTKLIELGQDDVVATFANMVKPLEALLVEVLQGHAVEKREASDAITTLMAVTNMIKTSLPQRPRSNAYAGKCGKCSQPVEAQAGRIEKQGGRWVTYHLDGQCPEKAAAAPKAEVPEGMHRLADGRIFKVQQSPNSGRRYAKELHIHLDAEGKATGDGHFVYVRGGISLLSADTIMSLEEAKAYGALYGVCCNCGRTLTDEKSIAAGIGPVCVKRFTF